MFTFVAVVARGRRKAALTLLLTAVIPVRSFPLLYVNCFMPEDDVTDLRVVRFPALSVL